jgi:hypothetical protein
VGLFFYYWNRNGKKMTSQERKGMSDVKTLAAEYLRRADQIGGCGDGGCVVFIRGGMHTNGGCRCARSINDDKLRNRHIHVLLSVAQRLARAVLAQTEKEF